MDAAPQGKRSHTRFSAWAELARVPNTLTAVADILAGCGLALGVWPSPWRLILLCLSSVAFYWAGMILNDVFDVEQDRVQQRKRPLVDGRIRVSTARAVGWSLLAVGLSGCVLQGGLDFQTATWIALLVGLLLSLTILTYDSFLKATPAGPLLMGLCRGLNLLLGTSLAGNWGLYDPSQNPHVLLAVAGHTLYVTGFTIAARREAIDSLRQSLLVGWLISLLGLAVLAMVPMLAIDKRDLNLNPRNMYPILIGLVSYPLVKRAYQSIQNPSPLTVQRSIKQAIMTIIALDAALVAEFVGSTAGMLTLLLIVPSLLIGMRFKST